MSHPHGTNLGGIRTLEDMRLRCRIDPITDCWRWSLSTSEGHPRVWVVQEDGTRAKLTGASAAYLLSHGNRPRLGRMAYRTCLCNLCVNPDHVAIGTRSDHGKFMRRMGAWKNQPNRIAANTRTCRERASTKLTLELAREIRASTLTNKALAAIYGVPASQIGAIKRGQAWREAASNSSVFNFAA